MNFAAPNPRPAKLVAQIFARPSVGSLAPRLFGFGPVLRVVTMDAACRQLYQQLSGMPPRDGGASAAISPLLVAPCNATISADGATHDGPDGSISDLTDPAQPLVLGRVDTSTNEPPAPLGAVSAPTSPASGHDVREDLLREQRLPIHTVSLTAIHLCCV